MGGVLLAAALAGLAACAPERPPVPWVPPAPPAPFTATVRVLFEARGRATAFRAGCSVDPAQGARVEVRDPMGSTRLLLLLYAQPLRIILVDPARKVRAIWHPETESLPWVPEALWMALTGKSPEGAELAGGTEGRVGLRWTARGASLKGTLRPSPQGPAPFASVELRGRGVRIEIRVSDAALRSMSDGALDFADLETYNPVSLWDILPGGEP